MIISEVSVMSRKGAAIVSALASLQVVVMTFSPDTYRVKREQLDELGFCSFPGVLPPDLIDHYQKLALECYNQAPAEKKKAQTGSMITMNTHPGFADLIAYQPAIDVLKSLGFDEVHFTDGYLITKPPRSPRLFWHYDWSGWPDPVSYDQTPPQVFFMYYLTETTRQNGCLRVVPRSHYVPSPFHEKLGLPHNAAVYDENNQDTFYYQDHPEEIDVPVKAGDLLIGDPRLLHAAHANQSDQHRTLFTLWYQTRFSEYSERLKARIVQEKIHPIPDDWPAAERAKVEALWPRYEGDAEILPRSEFIPEGRQTLELAGKS